MAVVRMETERAEKFRRGKLLLKLRNKLIGIKIEDEGDRVYLRSTNDADALKEIIAEIDEYGWQEFMREKDEPDIFESCRKANAENLQLVKALKLQEAADLAHVTCNECEGEEVPELCAKCFPLYDEARVARRAALESVKS